MQMQCTFLICSHPARIKTQGRWLCWCHWFAMAFGEWSERRQTECEDATDLFPEYVRSEQFMTDLYVDRFKMLTGIADGATRARDQQ